MLRLRRIFRKPVIAYILIASPLIVALGWLLSEVVVYVIVPPPLFHRSLPLNEGLRYISIPPLFDQKGTYGYTDLDRNLIALVVTRDPIIQGVLTPTILSRDEAMLLADGPYAARVRAERNTLVVIVPGKDEKRLVIPAGAAQRLRSRFSGEED